MNEAAQHWEQMYNQIPLTDVPRHFAGMRRSPFLLEYLTSVLKLCPQGARTLETGIGSGYGAIWLSLRGIQAEGIDYAPGIVERARQVNNILEGQAAFRVGDVFDFYREDTPRYTVIHHQGVLEHFTALQIQAALAQQVASAEWVVFSVPSVYYPFEPEFGDERLLPLEEWRHLLIPFDIAELRYYGDPALGGKEQVLVVLRGQPVTEALRSRMHVPAEPYPDGISAIVHTRNEERHLEDCLRSLADWTSEILVCDMESEDRTVEIARSFTDQVISHPRIQNFDRARNVSAMRARYRWVLYLDADERAPAGLGPCLKHLLATHGNTFEALLLPFRHYFAGQWLQCLYPGYTAPRVLKNGKFVFRNRLHSGAQVDGRVSCFPADNPDLALIHYSFDSLSHYLDKLNRYTDGEAANMHADGHPYSWQRAIAHFVEDFQGYYDRGQAMKDGVHGFLYSFLSAFYRFEQHAKLYERRYRAGQLQPQEQAIPASVEQVLEFALQAARHRPLPAAPAIRVDANALDAATVVWSGPLHDPSGYGEESRHFLHALDLVGTTVCAHPIPWSQDEADMPERERRRLEELTRRPAKPGFVHIVHNFAPSFFRHPDAAVAVGRTMFETDRLPQEWVRACNRMDAIWVPSEFHQRTFTDAGVSGEKLAVMPECFDPLPYQQTYGVTSLTEKVKQGDRYIFLSIFDWTRHKGWDVLLRGFLEAFEGREDVALVLKVWSTMGYTPLSLQEQAQEYVLREIGHDLRADPRIHFVTGRLSQAELFALYQACDAYVMPSRGEGWGRPYMEAMAFGKPTIGTNWSGNTAFMTAENSYLVDYDVVDVPEIGWKEIGTYRGHRWAEPARAHLIQQMRRVVTEQGEAKETGRRAREEVTERFSRLAVGKLVATEIACLQEQSRPHPVLVLPPTESNQHAELETQAKGRKAKAPKPVQTVTVRWEGAQFSWHSLAHVNREFCLGLLGSGKVELALVPTEPSHFRPEEDPRFQKLAPLAFASLSRPADVHVRHFFPPRLESPAEGQFVLIQPWEYGYLPERWIQPIQENVREVWCYSQYVKDVYLASGLPEEKLQVVPLGVDTSVFRPDAPPYVFTSEPGARPLSDGRRDGRFVFLFVGGSIHRKGIDILLDAYLKAFSAYDEVCLVVKDTGTNTVYRDANHREKLLSLTEDTTRPPIVYLEDDLSAAQLAGVYTACDCLVQPYRGEGFCLPVLEAMACGLPTLVPEGGPTDDFVDANVGWRLSAEHRPFGNGRIGEWECAGPTWMFEVSPVALGRLMREVYHARDEVKRRGAEAVRKVRADWTWEHATNAALTRLHAIQADSRSNTSKTVAFSTSIVQPKAKHAEGDREAPRQKPSVARTVPLVDRRSVSSAPAATRPLPTISLCMIVRNEERVLDACLTSVKPFVDEIILVDTGSSDRTVEIAKEHGVRLFDFPWCDDFSAARNVSLENATGDWLFWMDADDTLPEESGKRMHELVLLAEKRTAGFLMQVHIPPAPGETGFTIVDHVKLFRNTPHHRFERRIHEQILEPIYRHGGQIERSDLYVVHSGYDYSPEGQQKKRARDLTILELELAERPNDAFTLFNIGMTAYHLKDFPKAVSALEGCLAVSKPHESTVRKVYAMLAGCRLEQGEPQRARELIRQGLSLFPNDPELLFRGGIVCRECGDLTGAEEHYLRLMTAREVGHIDSLDVSMTGFKAHHNLALIYQDMGKPAEAEAQWKAALGDHPSFVPSWLGLAELYLKLRRFEDARGVLTTLEAIAPEEAERLRMRLSALVGTLS